MQPHQRQSMLDALEQFGSCEITVQGHSMRPCVRDGQGITLTKPPACPRLGMVAGFFQDEQFILHRIVGVKQAGRKLWVVQTRGDAYPGSLIELSYERVAAILPAEKQERLWTMLLAGRLGGLVMVYMGPLWARAFQLAWKVKDKLKLVSQH